MDLWDAYWSAIGKIDAESNGINTAYGSWFSCGAFDPHWSLLRLLDVVKIVPIQEPDSLIMARMAEIAQVDLALAIEIISLMVYSAAEKWRVGAWDPHLKMILMKCMLSEQATVREATELLINDLGRMGYLEFGELLIR